MRELAAVEELAYSAALACAAPSGYVGVVAVAAVSCCCSYSRHAMSIGAGTVADHDPQRSSDASWEHHRHFAYVELKKQG